MLNVGQVPAQPRAIVTSAQRRENVALQRKDHLTADSYLQPNPCTPSPHQGHSEG